MFGVIDGTEAAVKNNMISVHLGNDAKLSYTAESEGPLALDLPVDFNYDKTRFQHMT